MKKSTVITLALSLVFCLFIGKAYANEEMEFGQFFTLLDDNQAIISQTAMRVNIGDEFITADNNRFQVVRIEANNAYCQLIGKEDMPVIADDMQASQDFTNEMIPTAGNKPISIAIYHTHSDESYVPSDGKESIEGNGGIYDVGNALADELKKQGINVNYNDANHNPHDNNAYNRSRKTAAALLRKAPDVILDVHRDAVPAEQYDANVNGEKVTKVKLVVGKQNPNNNANLEFAKQIKAAMDKKAPGLSNGIFIGKGDFNQDLSPRAILIEVGTHNNSKAEAEEGVRMFAEALPIILGASSPATQQQDSVGQQNNKNSNTSAAKSIVIILVVVGIAAAAYYYLNKGSQQNN